MHGRVRKYAELLRRDRGMSTVFIAHSDIRRRSQPHMAGSNLELKAIGDSGRISMRNMRPGVPGMDQGRTDAGPIRSRLPKLASCATLP